MAENSYKVHGEPVFFSLEDLDFRLNPLDPISSLVVLEKLRDAVIPVFTELFDLIEFKDGEIKPTEGTTDGEIQSFFTKLLGTVSLLREIYPIFADACEVKIGNDMQKVKKFEHVFARRLPLMVAWLIGCVRREYEDFLAENGLTLLLGEAKGFMSLLGSASPSGS